MKQTKSSTPAAHDPNGPYILSGPVGKPDGSTLPLRGDLAHIALAGQYFVPHYAVPQPRAISAGGAMLYAANRDDSEALCQLAQGTTFEVLDIGGGWAWGCVAGHGPVGYVALDRLEAPAP